MVIVVACFCFVALILYPNICSSAEENAAELEDKDAALARSSINAEEVPPVPEQKFLMRSDERRDGYIAMNVSLTFCTFILLILEKDQIALLLLHQLEAKAASGFLGLVVKSKVVESWWVASVENKFISH